MNSRNLMTNEAVEMCAPQGRRIDYDCEKTTIARIVSEPPQGSNVVFFPSRKEEVRAEDRYRQTVRDALEAALEVCEDLMSGVPLLKIAKSDVDIDTFGMGHMLSSLMDKEILTDPGITTREIVDLACRQDAVSGGGLALSRHQLIRILKDTGLFKKVSSDRAFKPAGTTPSLRAISALAEDYIMRDRNVAVSLEQITSPSRLRNLVDARFIVIWIMRHVCGHSLSLIGTHIGNRDHTTILNSLNNTSLTARSDIGFARELETMCEKADTIGVFQHRMLLWRQASRF